MRRLIFIYYIFTLLIVSGSANANVILRCEGKSSVEVLGEYSPKPNETCFPERKLCLSDFVHFWMLSESEAFPSDLPGKNYTRRKEVENLQDRPFGKLLYRDSDTGNTVSFNPTTGEYFLINISGVNRIFKDGFCEVHEDKKLFKF